MDTDNSDVNGNGCDWYKEENNAVECGDHDGIYDGGVSRSYGYFEAHEDCCVCKYLSGIKKSYFKKVVEFENICNQ